MKTAPMSIKVILVILMCAVCSTALVGVITRDAMAFKIAGTCMALCAILVVGYRIAKKSGDV